MKVILKDSVAFILFFLVFTMVVNVLFLILIATTDWDFVKRRQSINFNDPDFDLLVLGSSISEYAMDTEYLNRSGLKSFNLSLVGSSVKTAYVQLSEYLNRYQKKPKVVILGVNSFLEKFHQEGIQPVVEFTMKGHKFGIKDLPITKFNWAAMELLKKAVLKQYRRTKVIYGHKEGLKVIPDNSRYRNIYLDLPKYETAKWINKLATLCAENNIKFIIIDIPGVKETQNLSEIGPYIIKYPDSSLASLYNLNSQDFCKFIDKDKDWAGMSHFNKWGARKFTIEMNKIVFKDRIKSNEYLSGIF